MFPRTYENMSPFGVGNRKWLAEESKRARTICLSVSRIVQYHQFFTDDKQYY